MMASFFSIETVATIAIGSFGLLSVVLLIAANMKKRSAAARFLVLQCGLTATMLLPVIVLLPGVPLGWFAAATASESVVLDAGSRSFGPMQNRSISTSLAPRIAANSEMDVAVAELSFKPPATTSLAETTDWFRILSWQQLVISIALLGTVLMMLRLLLAKVQTHRLLANAGIDRSATDQLQQAMQAVAARTDFANVNPVRLGTSHNVSSPVTLGAFRPVILLPNGAANWSADRLRMVLAHELAHVVRHDVFWQWTSQFARAFVWFNPLVWITLRLAVTERERACDDRVLRSGERASDYAETLLSIATAIAGNPRRLSGTVSMAEPPLKTRVRVLLDESIDRRATSWRGRVTTVAVVATILAILGFSRPFQTAKAVAQTPEVAATTDSTIDLDEGKDDSAARRLFQDVYEGRKWSELEAAEQAELGPLLKRLHEENQDDIQIKSRYADYLIATEKLAEAVPLLT
ncbi:M56 family metallopeptidase, partial [Novipirellula artificiosorum]|uniref:M56 family metallopeptidase n=1 Tax=Novipirellula artificiosorum TaxID=2528016 RepID=UPI0011B3E9C0